jgi:microcystin degradation protein MlrC
MPRILIAECKQEVSSFNPVPSHYEDFSVLPGSDMVDFHRDRRLETGGALGVFSQYPDVEIVPTYSARARTSAGTLAQKDFERIAAELLEAVRSAPAVDGAYISLHGAMSAEREDDPEGYLLSEIRRILGAATPIVISLDLHAILTDRMLQSCDAAVIYHTYPHVDFLETGQRAARLLMRIMGGEVSPVMARVFIPALVRGDELITATGLLGRLVRRAQEMESRPPGLAAAMNIGNPFTDVSNLGSNSLVVADGDGDWAVARALELAREFWEVREKLQAEITPLPEAVRIATETTGTTILKDAADATSSGASGDSNTILRALLESGYGRRALIPIVDRAAVGRAMAAGVGAEIQAPVGGTQDPRFEPVTIKGVVRMLSDGCYTAEYSGAATNAGPTAVVQVGSITLIITSRSVSLTDRSLFLAHGQDPRAFDAVVVKSPHCRRDYFDDWAEVVMTVDTPGSTSANLPTLGHTVCPRPMFPLDAEVAFDPQPKLYRSNVEG